MIEWEEEILGKFAAIEKGDDWGYSCFQICKIDSSGEYHLMAGVNVIASIRNWPTEIEIYRNKFGPAEDDFMKMIINQKVMQIYESIESRFDILDL